jgi:hypothetical protein
MHSRAAQLVNTAEGPRISASALQRDSDGVFFY